MRTEILNLCQRDRLIPIARPRIGGFVVLRIGSKSADLDLASRDRAVGVNDNSEERVRERLLRSLRADIDAAEPAAVARVAVVPSYRILELALVAAGLEVADHVFICFVLGIHAGFGAFDGQAEGGGYDYGVARDLALHEAHDFDRPS